MTAVFFKISDIQADEVQKMMSSEGYTNKAEFFRFLIKFFKYHKSSTERDFDTASRELAILLKDLNKKNKLKKSLEEQLEDV